MSDPVEESENAVAAKEDVFKVSSMPIHVEEEKGDGNVKKEDEVKTNRVEVQRPEKIPYTPPEWRLKPPDPSADCQPHYGFYIEVIKNGTIVDVIRLHDLRCESFVTVGRFAPCEIQLDHPSVSRYHCVLQYGLVANRECWTVYDLGSTHGTRLNKQPVKKRAYVPLRPGYVLQFANSTRIFSFCGPSDEEMDPLAAQQDKPSSAGASDETTNTEEEGGKYYEKDPLGYLDKYFEREGAPMSFQYARAEKGAAEWSCSIELLDFPDNEALVAGTGVTRKLAQVQCALLACHRLHAAGLLNVISLWNKRASYAENDYYDSDEDIYLDRTGQIEAQRVKRRRRLEVGSGSSSAGSLTFDELTKSLAETEEKLKNTAREIQRLLSKNCYTDADGQLVSTSTNFSTRMALSQMRAKEKRFDEERNQLRRLVELTRPRLLDDIMPVIRSSPVVGSSVEPKKNKEPSTSAERIEPSVDASIEDRTDAATTECKREPVKPDSSSENLRSARPDADVPIHSPAGTVKETAKEDRHADPEAERSVRVYQPTAPPVAARTGAKETVIMPKYGLITREEARVKKPTLTKRRQQKITEDDDEDDLDGRPKPHPDYSDAKYISREDYATWLPPQDQTGDGTTKLNEKFKGRY